MSTWDFTLIFACMFNGNCSQNCAYFYKPVRHFWLPFSDIFRASVLGGILIAPWFAFGALRGPFGCFWGSFGFLWEPFWLLLAPFNTLLSIFRSLPHFWFALWCLLCSKTMTFSQKQCILHEFQSESVGRSFVRCRLVLSKFELNMGVAD